VSRRRPLGGDRAPLHLTGFGLRTAAGSGIEPVFSDVMHGRSRIGAMRNIDVSDFSMRRGAVIDRDEEVEREGPRFLDCCRLALEEAIADATAHARSLDRGRTGIALGTTLGLVDELGGCGHSPSFVEARRLFDNEGLVDRVSEGLGLEGPRSVFSLACASSLCAAEQASLDLALGRADAMIAGGADTLGRFMQGGFSSLHGIGIGAPQVRSSEGDGLILGEGAAFALLEPAAEARRRGRAPRASLEAQRLVSDGHHLSRPDPSGSGMSRALTLALDDAGIEPSDVGAAILTAVGSKLHEEMLRDALERSLGARARTLPLTTFEGSIGHVLAASGIVALALAARIVEDGFVPRPFFLETLAEGVSERSNPEPAPLREGNVLTLTVGFGGFNGVSLVGRAE
jgi:3-oxoacyl-[acyl-carrier-protein] synthase II